MTEMKHTPLPFTSAYEGSGDYVIYADGKEIACVMQPNGGSGFLGGGPADENDANARFIVTACNSHYDLLKALKACEPFADNNGLVFGVDIRAAIAKAEGRT